MVPVGEVFVHRLSSSRPNGVGVLSNLVRDIEQRDNDGNSADDLPDIRQVIEIHVSEPLAVVGEALRFPNKKLQVRAGLALCGCATIHHSPLSRRSYSALS